MTPLEQRIAKVINHDWTCDSRATDGEVFNESLCDCGLADKARAVVAVLPKADVSDEAVWESISHHGFMEDYPKWDCDCGFIVPSGPDEDALMKAHCVAVARAPFDVQAAAHAAEVEALRRWKAEATDVLTGWEAAFLALPREVRESPGNLGRSKAGVTHDWIRAALDGDA